MDSRNTRRRRERNRRNIWENNDWKFPQSNIRHQTTDPGSSENTKEDKYKKILHLSIIFKLQKTKDKEKILKKARGKNEHLTYSRTKVRIISTSPQRQHSQDESEVKSLTCWEKKTYLRRILYPAKVSFKSEGEIKTFSEKQKLTEFVTSKPALQNFKISYLERRKMICQKVGST